jgi:hypothetical protein
MDTPKLKRVTIEIGYRCDDGYSTKKTLRTGDGTPEGVILSAAYELSRMVSLYGDTDCEDRLDAEIKRARMKVGEFLNKEVINDK